ncbi:MAG: methyltransferase family protein [Spirochaetia bacterium]
MEHNQPHIGIMGIAHTLLPVFLPGLTAAVFASIFIPEIAGFLGPWRVFGFALGTAWAGFGIFLYLDIIIRLITGLSKKRLATRGTYGMCRHPLYAWWIFLVLPSLAFIMNNWLFLVLMPIFFFAVKKALPLEEGHLRREFGEEYHEYSKAVRALVPVPKKRRNSLGMSLLKLLGLAAIAGFAFLLSYVLVIRNIVPVWGLSSEEVQTAFLEDSWLGEDTIGFTQGIDIAASPEEVWPWLIQVGYMRAGWYNLDFINASLGEYFYEGNRSAERIIPELQELEIGDVISIAPGMDFPVRVLNANQDLVMMSVSDSQTLSPIEGFQLGDDLEDEWMSIAWGYHLSRLENGGTRLSAVFRSRVLPGIMNTVFNELFIVIGGGILQQPAMLHGLKMRAEGRL